MESKQATELYEAARSAVQTWEAWQKSPGTTTIMAHDIAITALKRLFDWPPRTTCDWCGTDPRGAGGEG